LKQSISIHCYDFDDYTIGEGFRTGTRTGKRKLTAETGMVNAEINIYNQRDEICVSGSWKMIVTLHPKVEK